MCHHWIETPVREAVEESSEATEPADEAEERPTEAPAPADD